MGNNYQRLFYIFQSMDNNLGNPTGYLKVEINGQVAKLQVSLSNIPNRQGIKYRLYGISKYESLQHTVICDIEYSNGRADLRINLDTGSVGSNGLDMEAINVYAVIAQTPDRYNSVSCPLVAYKSGEVQWKQQFEASLKNVAVQQKTEKTAQVDNETKALLDYNESLAPSVNSGTTASAAYSEAKTPAAYIETKAPAAYSEAITPVDLASKLDNNVTDLEQQTMLTEEGLEGEELVEETVGNITDLVEVSYEETDDQAPNTETNKALTDSDQPDESDEISFENNKAAKDYDDDITSRFEAALNSIYNNEKIDDSAADNDIISSAERNFREISSINEGEEIRSEFDINMLKEELDKSFENCNPFSTRSKRFRWWKINSPGYLNNILFRNNVKTYLLFNPKVMLAQYKYKYIIFGIRYDKYSGRERLVCGVPGVYSIDENPFGNLGSWAQLEGYKPKYGAFGYWIILIDPRTGKLIKIK